MKRLSCSPGYINFLLIYPDVAYSEMTIKEQNEGPANTDASGNVADSTATFQEETHVHACQGSPRRRRRNNDC